MCRINATDKFDFENVHEDWREREREREREEWAGAKNRYIGDEKRENFVKSSVDCRFTVGSSWKRDIATMLTTFLKLTWSELLLGTSLAAIKGFQWRPSVRMTTSSDPENKPPVSTFPIHGVPRCWPRLWTLADDYSLTANDQGTDRTPLLATLGPRKGVQPAF